MASLFIKSYVNSEGREENVVYATIFRPTVMGGNGTEKVVANLSVSAGKDQNGQTRYETWNGSFKADDAAKSLQDKDRVKITAYCLSHQPYNKETKQDGKVYLNVMNWEKAESRQGQQTAAQQAPVQQAAPAQAVPFAGVAPAQQAADPFGAPAQAPAQQAAPAANPFGADPFAGAAFPNFNVQ